MQRRLPSPPNFPTCTAHAHTQARQKKGRVECCIYMMTTPSGKRYIGQSKNYVARWKVHKYNADHNKGNTPGITRAIRKYGWDGIKKEILVWCRPEDLDSLEIKLIAAYDTFHNGLNCDPGGNAAPRKRPDDGRFLPHPKCTETWNAKRLLHGAAWEAKRLRKENERLAGVDPIIAERKRHYSRMEKEHKAKKRLGIVEDRRLKPSVRRHATWRSKLEARIAHLPPKKQAQKRRFFETRRRYRAKLRAQNKAQKLTPGNFFENS